LAAKGIGSADDGYDDDYGQQSQTQSQRQRQETTRERPQRRSPPVGGGGGRGYLGGSGKVAVTLPTSFIKGLKEAGIWDNVEARNRAIRAHQQIKSERG
jgi:hypothetical protein